MIQLKMMMINAMMTKYQIKNQNPIKKLKDQVRDYFMEDDSSVDYQDLLVFVFIANILFFVGGVLYGLLGEFL